MYAVPYLLSQIADGLLKASVRLQGITREPWTVDWEKFALVCRHGVVISPGSALADSTAALLSSIERQHAITKVSRPRL